MFNVYLVLFMGCGLSVVFELFPQNIGGRLLELNLPKSNFRFGIYIGLERW